MSFEALAWATKQNIGSASDKLILLAYADRHNEETGCAYPSIAALCEFSSLNRKTVISSVARLEAAGILSDTGERRGETKQIKVYRVNIGTVPKSERSRKRNSTEKVVKQSQKRDTEPVRTYISSEANASSEKRARADGEIEAVVSKWNAMAKGSGLPVVEKITDSRRRSCRARLREDGLQAIACAIERIPRSPFLTGQTKDWRADFDFLLRPDTVTKINEGKYDQSSKTDRQSSTNPNQRRDGFLNACYEAAASQAGHPFAGDG